MCCLTRILLKDTRNRLPISGLTLDIFIKKKGRLPIGDLPFF